MSIFLWIVALLGVVVGFGSAMLVEERKQSGYMITFIIAMAVALSAAHLA